MSLHHAKSAKAPWPYRPSFLLQVTDIRLLFIATLLIYKIKSPRAFIYLLEKFLNFWPWVVSFSRKAWCCGEMRLLPWARLHLAGEVTPLLHFWRSFLLVHECCSAYAIITHCCQLTCAASFEGKQCKERALSLSRQWKRENYFGEQALLFRPKLLKDGFASALFVTMCLHSLLWISKKACATWGRYQNA